MGALGIGAAAVPSILSSSAFAATPKKGGKITLGVEAAQAKDSRDPTRYFSTANILMGFSVYDSLINRGPDLKPTPWLAESWEVGSDASEWIFQLRKDVEWHDGKPFTADEVIYACGRHTAENSESPAKGYMSQIAEMTKDGDHVVKFKLTSPNADFPIVLSDTRVRISTNGYEDFTDTTIGTGPYKVKEWKSGSRYMFERNDNYWGSDGPWVDELEVIGIGDITARVNALLSGDINVMLEFDPKAVKLIERNSKVDLIRSPNRNQLRHIQFAFQMADVALNPKHRIDKILGRPLRFYFALDSDATDERVTELLQLVELPAEYANRFPRQLSGGEKQRVNLARALAAEPQIIICDEIRSALDTVVAKAILALLKKLQDTLSIGYVFISHDLSTMVKMADTIVVMRNGEIVEYGPTNEVMNPPHHPYTELLLDSVPEMRTDWLEGV